MQRIVTLAVAVAVGGCLTTDEGGPNHGLWRLDAAEGWFCVHAGAACAPPAYFTPPPIEVEVRDGGALDWGALEQDGVIDGACIRVAAATEQGVPRTEVTFCDLIENGVDNDARAFAIIGWNAGAADECTCSAHFDHAD